MSRIIAGRAKGARLASPKGDTTRPTSDRVKEALFSTLTTWFDTVDEAPENHLAGVSVLDLYAGTGAVGLEAASRGAEVVVAVDHHTARTITDNARRTGLGVEVRPVRARQAVAAPGRAFDLVFVDPPYDVPGAEVDQLIAQLVAVGGLAPQALVVVERPRRADAPVWPAEFTSCWDRRYGDTTLHFGATDQEQT
ncbi:MAG: 16S rRNA (guanine(966)-N(2))-methyltransferase RsmD [Propionibacteriaceae bacterium]|nr:16S rRNA (guanine(966)-N(2))-methyltransferase RsmD [Propionibacteriaceae bacterium]